MESVRNFVKRCFLDEFTVEEDVLRRGEIER